MPKFRLLSFEELNALKDDFIKFLVVNGIAAEDWMKMLEKQSKKADRLIELFSDVVFQGIVSKVQYMEFCNDQGIKIFRCDEASIQLIGLESSDFKEVDFMDRGKVLTLLREQPSSFTVYKASKEYQPDRSGEIFRMLQSGGLVADGVLFELLDQMI
jgi:hypothetical protein